MMYNNESTPKRKIATKQNMVRDTIIARISTGCYYNGRLPGIIELAKEFKVNSLTVRKALNELEKTGVIEKIARVGTFIKRKNCIAVLRVTSEENIKNNYNKKTNSHPGYYSPVIEEAKKTLSERGLSIQTHTLGLNNLKKIKHISTGIDGAIVIGDSSIADEEYSSLSSLIWVKAMGEIDSPINAHHITYDNKIIGKIAADYLMSKGCDNIYFLGGLSFVSLKRYEIFKYTLNNNGIRCTHIDLDIHKLAMKDFVGIAKRELPKIFNKTEKCGLFLQSDAYVNPVYQILYSIGIAPEKDIRIISCDNYSPHLFGAWPPPATIDIKMQEIGKVSAEQIIELINNNGGSPHAFNKIVVPQLVTFN